MNVLKQYVVFGIYALPIFVSVFFISAEISAAAVADFNSSLVAHYTFDDTTNDSVGSNHGTAQGNPTYVEGKMGKAIQLDGVDDLVLVGTPEVLNDIYKKSGTGMSISVWVKPSQGGSFISKNNPAFGGWYMALQGSGRLYFEKDGSKDLAMRAGINSYTMNEWNHIVMTWDGLSTSPARWYVNGNVRTNDITLYGEGLYDDAPNKLAFGAYANGANRMGGLLDDVRIYNSVLTADEITQLYALGGGSTSGTSSGGTPAPSAGTTPNPVVTSPDPNTGTPPPSSTITALSCSDTDIQKAVNDVANLGIVMVPAGTCTWNVGVSISGKSLILKGAGIDQTIIKEELIANHHSLAFAVGASAMIRLTGFTFDGSKTKDNYASVMVSGAPGRPSFRIDHNKFVNVSERGIIAYSIYGLIDHNTFIRIPSGFSPTLISVMGDTASWDRPQDLGTSNAVYMEDNTFIHNIQNNGPFDMYTGARYVFRHNQVYGNGLGHHGFDSSVTGTASFEIYDNTFVNASPTGEMYVHGIGFEFRSGSGVLFNNTFNRAVGATGHLGKYDLFASLRNYRSGDGYVTNYGFPFPWNGKSPWNGICDGSNALDGNLKDTDTNGDGIFDVSSGYPCRDQIGRGPGPRVNGQQVYSPVYSWNNNFQGVIGGHLVVGGYSTFQCQKTGGATLVSKATTPSEGSPISWVCTGADGGPNRTMYERIYLHIKEGRDYFNNVSRPGYAPYMYPHPLSVVGFTSDAGGAITEVPLGTPAPAIPLPKDGINSPRTDIPTDPVPPPTTKPGDFNSDGAVNTLDFSLMVAVWNQSSPTHDLNKDGMVNSLDFSILVQNWTR